MRVKEIFNNSGESYGSRRMSWALKALGYDVGRYRARRLMRKLKLLAKMRKKFKVTTDGTHRYPVASNIVGQNFTVAEQNRVWGGDIRYL